LADPFSCLGTLSKNAGKCYKHDALLLVFFGIGSSYNGHQPIFMLGFDLKNALIPAEDIQSGGPGKDGIPAIDTPIFKRAVDYSFFDDDTYVLGISHNGVAKAYPVPILNWHEIVNDFIDTLAIVVTYCPLCGSGIMYEANIGGMRANFGISGLRYQSNLLLYDRRSESLWSQIPGKAVSGPLKGQLLAPLLTEQTTLGTWKRKHPETLVLTTRTGFVRNYQQSPYQDYDENHQLYFPPRETNDLFPAKERVIGVQVGNHYKAYPFSELASHPELILRDTYKGKALHIHYDVLNDVANVTDEQGTIYPSSTMYWFAWYAFYPKTAVFVNSNK